MIADAQTQADLELFRARDGGPPVQTFLDRTVTDAGRKTLTRALQAPLTDASGIRARAGRHPVSARSR